MVNFPTSLDNFTNPTANDTTNSVTVPHAAQHANLNDAVEAIEAVLGAGVPAALGVWRPIAPPAIGTGASDVLEFSSIPATYGALFLQFFGQTDAAVSAVIVRMTFETSPTAGAYNHQQLRGNGTAVSATENAGASDWIQVGVVTGASGSANACGASNVWLPGYAGTSLFKPVNAQCMTVTTIGASGLFVDMYSGLYESAGAIDRIRLTLASGNWTTTSRAVLYGVPLAA